MKYKQTPRIMVSFIRLVILWLTFSSSAYALHCSNSALHYQAAQGPHIQASRGELFSLLVWNIYKGKKVQWKAELNQLAQNKQLILLQEASPNLLALLPDAQLWHQYQARAFSWQGQDFGVMNLSLVPADKTCVQRYAEPWLRVHKSALVQLYHWQQQAVLVINIHSINFTLGTQHYQKQLSALSELIDLHTGPVLVAGDFNTWSRKRELSLRRFAQLHSLRFAKFEPDRRTQIKGRALDHVLYRGLRLVVATTPTVEGSDHQPLSLQFAVD